jgi:hypothetical protein
MHLWDRVLPQGVITLNIQVSIIIKQHKVTSHLPYKISNAIHGPKLTKYISEKEKWSPLVFRSIAWVYFSMAFNKLTTAHQIVTTKTMYSFWCKNSRHKRDRGRHKEIEDWHHVITRQETGAIIFHNGSWAQLHNSINKWKIHQDLWTCFDHGRHHFTRHPLKDKTSQPSHHFVPSLRANHILLNNAAATQSHIGWPIRLGVLCAILLVPGGAIGALL